MDIQARETSLRRIIVTQEFRGLSVINKAIKFVKENFGTYREAEKIFNISKSKLGRAIKAAGNGREIRKLGRATLLTDE